MIAVFLAPVYLLFQYYVLSWGFAWTSSLSPMLDSVWFRIPAAAVYLLLAFSPLFGLLVTREPFHHAFKAIGNFWLGLFLYILLLVPSTACAGPPVFFPCPASGISAITPCSRPFQKSWPSAGALFPFRSLEPAYTDFFMAER